MYYGVITFDPTQPDHIEWLREFEKTLPNVPDQLKFSDEMLMFSLKLKEEANEKGLSEAMSAVYCQSESRKYLHGDNEFKKFENHNLVIGTTPDGRLSVLAISSIEGYNLNKTQETLTGNETVSIYNTLRGGIKKSDTLWAGVIEAINQNLKIANGNGYSTAEVITNFDGRRGFLIPTKDIVNFKPEYKERRSGI